MDTLSIMDLVGFGVVFSLMFYLVSNWEKRDARNNLLPFHEIDINVLKSYLYPWVTTNAYKGLIKKVVLYRTSLDSHSQVTLKYIIFFDLISPKKVKEANKVLRDFLEEKTTILGDDFGGVYRENPPINFHDEWLLTDEKPESLSERNAVVLF